MVRKYGTNQDLKPSKENSKFCSLMCDIRGLDGPTLPALIPPARASLWDWFHTPCAALLGKTKLMFGTHSFRKGLSPAASYCFRFSTPSASTSQVLGLQALSMIEWVISSSFPLPQPLPPLWHISNLDCVSFVGV